MDYMSIDTESSGVFDYRKEADAPGQPRMASIGIILANDKLEEQERHSFLIRPHGWTFDDNSDAAKINKLTHQRLMDEGVEAAIPLRIYGDMIDDRRIVIAFNAPHDIKLLRAELRYAGFPDRYMQTRYICAMQGCRQVVDARTADGRKKAPRLGEACAHFGIPYSEDQHVAIDDAERALEIIRRLRDAGQMPAYKDPYDKPAKKPYTLRQARYQREAEEIDHSNFIRGASEDDK